MSAKNRRRDRKLRMATRMLETLRRVQLQDPTDHYRQQAMFSVVCALGRTFTRKGWDVRSRDLIEASPRACAVFGEGNA